MSQRSFCRLSSPTVAVGRAAVLWPLNPDYHLSSGLRRAAKAKASTISFMVSSHLKGTEARS